MKHNLVLYIIKFKRFDLVKIGISLLLRKRIAEHEKTFRSLVDLHNSFVIVGEERHLKTLEKQILNDLISMDFEDPPEEFPGISEIRSSEKVESLIEILEMKNERLDSKFKIYKGIDLSGFRSSVIPERYYPIEEEAKSIISPLMDIVTKMAKEQNVSVLRIANELIYSQLIQLGKIKNKKVQRTRTNYFVVPNSNFPEDGII